VAAVANPEAVAPATAADGAVADTTGVVGTAVTVTSIPNKRMAAK
jgi:hypothetical protein